jgi:nucleotide-binding universal stress UspA family protein
MYKTILLPVDLGHKETQTQACQTAAAIAASTGASLHVLTVIPDFGTSYVATFFPPDFEKKAMDEAERDLHAFTAATLPPGIKAHHIVGHGTIYREILRCAEETEADLIVMASHRPELADYLLGPNAARVVRHAKTSVLVVRPRTPA